MIRALLKLQACTTRPGRRAFVGKGRLAHGIAAGQVTLYEVTAATWPAVRRAVASADTSGRRTMGFSAVGPSTVEFWEVVEWRGSLTETRLRPVADPWCARAEFPGDRKGAL